MFHGSPSEWERLITYYGGNPYMLEILAATIQHLFDSSLTTFFDYNVFIFDEIRQLLDRQYDRLSDLEQNVMQVLATQNTACSFTHLRSHIPPAIPTTNLLAALKSLKARSLIARTTTHAALSPLLRDYVREKSSTSHSHALHQPLSFPFAQAVAP